MYGEVQAWYGASSSEASVEFDGVNPVNITLVDADNIVLGGFESGIVNFTVDTENMILTLLYEAPPVETVTIYAYNNAEWDDLYLYMYANDVPYDESWPGLAPTSSEEINGYSFNTYVIVKDENTPVNIIFNNNNNGSQVEYNGVITLDQDYYFEVNPNNVVLIEDPESFVPSDNTTPAPLTIYLLGDNVNGQSGWENPVAMTLEDDGTYTWTGTELGSKFKFNNGSWTDGYNIGAENEVNELELGVVFGLVNNENAQNILLAEDTYIENPSMVLDLENLTLTVTGTVVNTAPYVPGDVIYFMTSLDWTDGYELTKNEDGIYTGEIELIAPADSDIEFKLDCGNDKWYGAAAGQENVELVEGEATSLDLNGNGGNWTLTNWEEGTILVSVDWAAGVLTLEVQDSETDGIHSINASLNGDEAIYNLNGVRVDANKLTKGVYIINGKKVLVK